MSSFPSTLEWEQSSLVREAGTAGQTKQCIHKPLTAQHLTIPLWPAQALGLSADPREQPLETRAQSFYTILVKAIVSIRVNRIFLTFHEFTRVGKRPDDVSLQDLKALQVSSSSIKGIYLHNEISLENLCFSGKNSLQVLKHLLYSSIQQIIICHVLDMQ